MEILQNTKMGTISHVPFYHLEEFLIIFLPKNFRCGSSIVLSGEESGNKKSERLSSNALDQ